MILNKRINIMKQFPVDLEISRGGVPRFQAIVALYPSFIFLSISLSEGGYIISENVGVMEI